MHGALPDPPAGSRSGAGATGDAPGPGASSPSTSPAIRGRRRSLLILLAILALGAGLRLAGLDWGLPDERHFTSYRADEWRAVTMAMDLEVLRGEVVPLHKEKAYFNWGSLHLYFVSLACGLADAAGWIDAEGGFRQWSVETFARGHLLGRGVSALHGLAAIVVVYLLASRWFGRRAGLAAALVQALGPLDVLEAHCALVNVTLAFWTLAAVGMIGRALELGRTRAYLLAGVAVGIALSAKLNALPLLPLLGGAALWTGLARGTGAGPLVRRCAAVVLPALGAALVAYALASPAILLHPGRFLEQAHRQLLVIPSRGSGLAFEGSGNGYAFLFLHNLPVVLGWPLWAAAMGGIAWSAARALRALREGRWRTPSAELAGDAVCLGWLFLLFVPLGMSQTRFLRYLLPVVPVLYMLAARLVVQLDARLSGRGALLLRGAALCALVYTALYSAAQVQTLRLTDPRDQAVAWFEQHVPADSSVALLNYPSHLVPPVHPFGGPPATRISARKAERGVGPKRLRWIVLGLEPERLIAERPDYVVYNELEFAPFVRVGREGPVRIQEILERDYRDAAGPWTNDMRLFGITFQTTRTDTPGWLPATTVVRILERRDLTSGGE